MTALTRADIDALKIGYATPCLGMNPAHTLEIKFEALAGTGFKHVELGFGNYVAWVRSKVDLPPSTCPEDWKVDDEPDPSDDQIWEALYSHATTLKDLARQHGLDLLIMQPFNQFDGWPKGHEREEWVKRKAERWLKLCSMLGVEYLQVGANDQAGQGAGDEKTAHDLKWLAELGQRQEHPVKIAYEPWCFSPRVSDWEHCYETVKLADHSGLGLCLDTAQMALAPAYGFNPTTGDGYTPSDVSALLDRISKLDPSKIFFFEISDVQLPDPPLYKGSPYDDWAKAQPEGTPARSNWVLTARSIPYIGRKLGKDVKSEQDTGAAKVAQVAKAVFATGFRELTSGPVIWEVFEATEMEKEDQTIPKQYAEACERSRQKLFAELTA